MKSTIIGMFVVSSVLLIMAVAIATTLKCDVISVDNDNTMTISCDKDKTLDVGSRIKVRTIVTKASIEGC